jgi:hypothetical protein
MKQKTQMQYLIGELIDKAKSEDMISLKLVIGLAVVRLEKEKKQIEDAFDAGNNYDGNWELEEEYYNSTFGDSNEAGI